VALTTLSTSHPPLFLGLFDIVPKSLPPTPIHESPVCKLVTPNVSPPQPTPVTGAATSSSPPEDEQFYGESEDEEIFYDALEYFEDAKPLSSDTPTSTDIQQIYTDLIESENTHNGYSVTPVYMAAPINLGFSQPSDAPTSIGAPLTHVDFESWDGRLPVFSDGVSNPPSALAPFSPTVPRVMPTFTTAAIKFGSLREPSEPAPPTTSERAPISPSTGQAQADSARTTGSVPALVAAPRPLQKRALLIGLNYEQCGKESRLRHATSDARRFATALTKLGYSGDNTRVVTDEQGQSFPSCEYLLECMDWLVQDASEGDRLFFMFSGHCLFPHGEKEPYLVAADMVSIPRSTFQERLVSKVPAGAELSIVLDCCHAAGMVKLKYRIGQMVPEIKQTGGSEVCSESEQPAIAHVPGAALLRSFRGLETVSHQPLTLPPQATPAVVDQISFCPPTGTIQRRGNRGCVATGQPLACPAVPNQAPVSSLVASLTGIAEPPPPVAAKQSCPAQRRQPVIQGRPVPEFQERKGGFVSPSGKVIVWAGSGERLKAFEASRGVENGIVTNAMCSVLDEENRSRRERDAKKPNCRNIPINTRLQLAELWVSQEEPLSSPSPILNQAFDCPWKSSDATA
ncbi:Ca(2+)-dependent cysteine protease, partial [Ceratobasidium sp. 423]